MDKHISSKWGLEKRFPPSVFLLTMNAYHVLQDQDPLSQDLQGLPELLHGLTLKKHHCVKLRKMFLKLAQKGKEIMPLTSLKPSPGSPFGPGVPWK